MKLRELFLREADEVYIVIVRDSGEIIRVPGIPASALNAADFEEKLQRLIDRDYPQGNISVRGKWTVVDNDGEEIDYRALNPDPKPEGEIPPEDEIADPGETVPEPEPEPEAEPEPEPDIEIELPEPSTGVKFISPMEDFAGRYNRNVTRQFDKDRDYRNDETGELQPRMTADGQLVDENGQVVGDIDDVLKDNPELLGEAPYDERTQQILQGDWDGDGIIDDGEPNAGEPVKIRTEPYDVPNADSIQYARDFGSSLGGGADGDTGDEGVEGEEGAITGEQRAEIPTIIEELYRSISGLGTNETRMINALKRIKSPAHLEAVVQMYREEYNSSLPSDIIQEFRFEGGNTTQVIEEINEIMRPLGYELTGSQWFNLRWEKLPGVEVEIEPAGEE